METILIIAGCISIVLIVIGLIAFIRGLVVCPNEDALIETILICIGSVGLFLSLIL